MSATSAEARELRKGFLYTLGAFLFWGLSPLYWKQLASVPAFEQLAHRVVWCAPILFALLAVRGRLAGLGAVLRQRRTYLALLASTVMIGTNWFIFIWSIAAERLLETSLGYYINPLISVLFGMVFLGERLRPAQWLSCGLALVAVTVLTVRLGTLPWISLALAMSFGLYGLLRKTVPAGPEEGLALECWILAPVAGAWLIHRHGTVGGAFLHQNLAVDLLLVCAGLITAVPLLWFTHGARRLPLSTVGMLQYVAPTLQFLLAVVAFGEPFGRPQLVAFAMIWIALAIYTHDARRATRARLAAQALAER